VSKSYEDLVAEANAVVAGVVPVDLKARLDAGEQIVLIDVREPQEW